MMRKSPLRLRYASCCMSLSLLVLIVTRSANAIPHTYHVGPLGPGSFCDTSSIQSAIGFADAFGDTIVIDGGLTYSGQHLTIDGKSLTIEAGPCAPIIGGGAPEATANARVTISGNAGASSPVIAITGTSNVTLVDLQITGNTSSSDGGGISYTGDGTLTLTNVLVNLNNAADGGGIEVISQGGGATLQMTAGSGVLNNSASGRGGGIYFDATAIDGQLFLDATTVKANHSQMSGGGIAFRGGGAVGLQTSAQILSNSAFINGGGLDIEGPSTAFDAYFPGVSISGNSAGFNGGGAYLQGGISANLASADDSGVGMITLNHAGADGGGIYAAAANLSNASLTLALYSIDPSAPVSITDNTATGNGGGVYLQPNNASGATISFCAADFRLQHNGAKQGAAIYGAVDLYTGSNVYLNAGCSTSAVCRNSRLCNTIDNNYVDDPAVGSAIYIADDGTFIGNRVAMLDNNVAHLVQAGNDYDNISFSNCLMAHNTTNELVDVLGAHSSLSLKACTLANNVISADPAFLGTYAIRSDPNLTLTDIIFDEQPDVYAVNYSGGVVFPSHLSFILATETINLALGFAVTKGEPTFVDAANDDYHLQPTSLGIDYAPATSGIDLDGNPRSVDLPTRPDNYGIQDLGAFERRFACGGGDSIFCDGFNP